MAEFRYINAELFDGWLSSEQFTKLITFEPLKEADEYQLPSYKYEQLFPFINVKLEHPAMMNPYLATFLWRRYVRDGDVVIDPMAGVGGTPCPSRRGRGPASSQPSPAD